MKKLLPVILFTCFAWTMNAQVASIVPNQGNYNQTLTTTITLASGVMTSASPPLNLNDIYLQKGADIIYADNFTLYPLPWGGYEDSISAIFTIPSTVATGYYDVHVETYWGGPFPTPIDNMMTSGFFVGTFAGSVEGDVYFDQNQNGARDVGEVGLANMHVTSQPLGITAITDHNGHYIILSDTTTNTVAAVVPSFATQTSTPLSYIVSVPPDTLGNDFGMYFPLTGNYEQNFSINTHPMRCIYHGFSGWNITSTSPTIENGTITIIYSSNLGFYDSGITPDYNSGDTLRWNYSLFPFTSLSSYVTYDNPAAGDTVSYVVIDSVFDPLGNLQNVYSDSFTFVVSCSVDPNDKSVSPAGEGGMHFTLLNSDLTYTIRFQNTGSDTAFNVFILDTLDTNLDENTFTLLGSSHPVSVQIDASRQVRFSFDNIMLADSFVDEENSHGWVMYRISPIANITDGTPIENTASIYFDFNLPVVTNSTTNMMVTQIPTAIDKIKSPGESFVYPNPVTNLSTLVIPSYSSFDLTIYDVAGRQIEAKNISENYILVKNKFVPGIYHYQLRDKNGNRYNGKFIIAE